MVKPNDPETAVPLSVAVAGLNESQDGSPEALQVKGAVPELTEKICEYTSLCVAALKVAGEITGSGFTSSVQGLEAETPLASVTLMVKLNDPEAAVPVRVEAAALNVSQDGSPEALHVNGAVPELTEKACEYVSLCVAAAKLAGEIVGAAFTVIVNGCCAISPTASLT